MSEKIAYCKIFPPIGIARVGNSQRSDGYFIGPEGLEARAPNDQRRYKDASGAVLRQAARFRVYAFDAKDGVIGEITARQAKITWGATLANKKSEWFEFNGAAMALAQFEARGKGSWKRRNASVHGAERGKRLFIDPGVTRTITGQDVSGSDAAKFDFVGKFQGITDVYLGELRTDSEGRLLVLGGRGHSAAVDETGADVSGQHWITNYANNDFWHDDISDGPVECTVQIDGRDVPVKGRAWVLVAPPDFAPDIASVVTLFDVMEDVALKHELEHPGLPAPIGADHVEFWRDIYPILSRAMTISWVSDLALRGHAKGKAGNFSDKDTLDSLGDPGDEDGRLLRQSIFKRICKPSELFKQIRKTSKRASHDEQVAQANGLFMPALSGDEDDATTGDPTTWLTVTALQYRRLEAWAQDRFIPGTRHNPDPTDPKQQPGILTRIALDLCTGGAFYPGIEMTVIARSHRAYAEAYRLANDFEAGDVTKFMAVPWQADFFECNTHWWPAQRPDSVITARSAEELESAFSYEQKRGEIDRLMLVRQPWARGVESARPDPVVIEAMLFPPPNKSQDLSAYLGALTKKLSEQFYDLADVWQPVENRCRNEHPVPAAFNISCRSNSTASAAATSTSSFRRRWRPRIRGMGRMPGHARPRANGRSENSPSPRFEISTAMHPLRRRPMRTMSIS